MKEQRENNLKEIESGFNKDSGKTKRMRRFWWFWDGHLGGTRFAPTTKALETLNHHHILQ
jgi:hypothetical protein